MWPYVKGGIGLSVAGADDVRVDFNDAGGAPETVFDGGLYAISSSAALFALGVEIKTGPGRGTFFAEGGYEVLYLDTDINFGRIPVRIGLTF